MSELAATLAVDLDACAAEPIRIPGGIQPHGALLIADLAAERVLHVSANLESFVGAPLRPGDPLDRLEGLAPLRPELLALKPDGSALIRTAPIAGRPLHLSAHHGPQGLILEFEKAPSPSEDSLETLYPRVRAFIDRVAAAADVAEIVEAAAREVRELTGFNRVLLYSFEPNGDGVVLAEDTDGVLPSYLNLRFPAADIPAQARDLYKLSRIRLIPTADYQPAALIPPISPIDGQPVDLGRAALRSVSPVHLEYMRNMGTASSMSISILVKGELWGLISGHSVEPRLLNAQVRSACDHLGQVLSLRIEAHEQARRTSERLRLAQLQTDLLARLASERDFATGLLDNPEPWLAVGGGAGAALVSGETVIAAGETPPESFVREIADRLFAAGRAEAAMDSLADQWPEAAAHADRASGLLAVSISQLHPNYLMWFRPEAVRTVSWAGEPAKAVERGERLHPRKSFEQWKELVRLRALPWSDEEVESARAFRAAVQNFVLRRAEERAALTNRLAEINKELEGFSYSISHDLRAPFRHVVGYAEMLSERADADLDETSRRYLTNIRDSALTAGRLVDDLLSFSQMGRHGLQRTRVDVNRMVQDLRRGFSPDLRDRRVEWQVGDLPPAWADASMLRQVFANLMGNAVKYTQGRDPARISVSGAVLDDGSVEYTVADNGAGFDMAYVHKLFAVFQRLHRAEEFEGTGIGLALVKRIIERHGGSVAATGEPNAGASFTVTIPERPAEPPPGET